MNRRAYQVFSPVTLVVVMVAFLSAIFLANANTSSAASGKKKSSAVARISAVEHSEARIAELQGALKFTEDQEPLWSNLTLVMRDNAKNMDALTKDRADNKKTMNTVEYMKYQGQITETRSEQMKRFIPPFEVLYASLSDDQKTTIDALFRTGETWKTQDEMIAAVTQINHIATDIGDFTRQSIRIKAKLAAESNQGRE